MFRMLSRRSLLLTASLAAAFASAACSSDSSGSAASPTSTGSTSPAGTSSAGTSPAGTSSPSEPAALVLGPTGIGALKLGMSADEVTASGAVGKINYLSDTDDCGSASSHDPVGAYSLWVSRTKGLVGIVAIGAAPHTPEGVGQGATMAAVKKAYPAAKPVSGSGNQLQSAVPGNSAAFYQFDLIGGTTAQVILALKTQACFG
jgi:hypothetical protein